MTFKLVLIMAASVLIVSAAAQQSPMYAPMISPEASPAPAPGPDCLTVLANVSDCLTYVQVGSNLTVPDKPCCPEVAGLLESYPICLCEFTGQAAAYGIDVGRAITLPNICKLTLPALSCPGLGATTPSPSPSSSYGPVPSAGMSPEGDATSISPSTTSISPSTTGSNAAPSITLSRLLTLVCSAVACFMAFLN